MVGFTGGMYCSVARKMCLSWFFILVLNGAFPLTSVTVMSLLTVIAHSFDPLLICSSFRVGQCCLCSHLSVRSNLKRTACLRDVPLWLNEAGVEPPMENSCDSVHTSHRWTRHDEKREGCRAHDVTPGWQMTEHMSLTEAKISETLEGRRSRHDLSAKKKKRLLVK